MTERPLVLLAEDEALVADLVESALEEVGFAVVVVDSGDAALAWLGSDPAFVALVTDIRLGPGLNGWAVARKVREQRPGLPVVYVSGDSEAEWTSQGVPGSVLVPKPFAPCQIVIAISGLINVSNSPA
ncbi:response regulator [Phenylobacterium sp.]|uniref:response regulator n=1 Tax=Phenylobacterium sp. TaxID=1871053 RepID=UPI002CFC2180|nr:response regulator [Phenylobacterium sp.]HVI31018.1 response regulator [Phenylobacterium sp.]